MIVVDTNVLAYLVRRGEQTDIARAAYERDPEWLSPSFWRLELLNVLALSVRLDGMDPSLALAAFRVAEELVVDLEARPEPQETLRWSLDTSISAYDAEFVSAASRLGLPLVTADRRLVDRCPSVAVPLAAFANGSDLPA